MITKRIIPCLDVRNGRVVKGTNFEGIRDVADPVEMARMYNAAGADELVFYDITASFEGRALFTDILTRVASEIFIPLTVGGGIRTVEDFRAILACGADKISINSSALKTPELISRAAERFGSQCVVVAIDAKKNGDHYEVYLNGGRVNTGVDAVEWAAKAERLGAGEILLTSMDADGTKAGYDIPLTKLVAESVRIPVIASGGAGKLEHFGDVIQEADASAVLAASLFHYQELTIREVKEYLKSRGIPVRMEW